MEGEGADEILTHFAIVSQINLMPCLGFRVRSNYSLVTEAVGALATERSFSEFTCGLSQNLPVDIFHVTGGRDGNQPI